MKLIDLSVSITEDLPVYPGDPHVLIKSGRELQKDGFEDHYLSIGTHAGTHIDAPQHMIENGKGLDQFPLETFTGRGICIKIENKQFNLEKVKTINIQPGDIVFFYTSISDIFNKPEYFQNYPALPEEVASYLTEKKVKIIGVDTCSVDHDEFIAHKLFLKNDILIIENLTNLAELVNKQFTVYAFPLKLKLDGSPVRVVAEIQE
jgi:arylformamidase